MSLKVEKDGSVIVESVLENGAAYRASDLNGCRCPIRVRDEIIEINGVSLNVFLFLYFYSNYKFCIKLNFKRT
jgi:hypothetical protein